MATFFRWAFTPDRNRYQGVRPIHIVLLRLLYGLMFAVLGTTVWGHILSATVAWDPYEGACASA